MRGSRSTTLGSPHDKPQAREDFGGRHRVVADGPAGQPDDDLRRHALRRPGPLRANGAAHREALPQVPPVPAAPRAIARRRVLGDRAPHRHGRARPAYLPSGPRRQAGVAGAGQPTRRYAARSGAAAVAIPSGRGLRRRKCADPAHPPLLRRRHRARASADVDDRRVAQGPAGDAVRAGGAPAPQRPRRSAAPADAAALRRDEARAHGGNDADREGGRDLVRSGTGGRAGRAGRRADRRDREARADAAGFADAVQGQAERRQSASPGPSRSRSTR